jgi:hypothetical protein
MNLSSLYYLDVYGSNSNEHFMYINFYDITTFTIIMNKMKHLA